MKILFRSFGLFFSILLIVSCQREVDERIDPTPDPPSFTDSTLLEKLIVLDTTLPAGLDTLEIHFFKYDAQKRIEKITGYSRADTASTAAFQDTAITYYFYTGTDTLPARQVVHDNYLNGEYQKDTTYYSYQNGLVSYDSTRATGYVIIPGIPDELRYYLEISTFSGAGNTILENDRSYMTIGSGNQTFSETNRSYIKTVVNGNIVNQTISTSGCGTCPVFSMQVTYDNKVNPFRKVYPVRHPVLNVDRFFHSSDNNITEWITSYSHERFTYKYRSDGYPLSIISEDLLNAYTQKKILVYGQ